MKNSFRAIRRKFYVGRDDVRRTQTARAYPRRPCTSTTVRQSFGQIFGFDRRPEMSGWRRSTRSVTDDVGRLVELITPRSPFRFLFPELLPEKSSGRGDDVARGSCEDQRSVGTSREPSTNRRTRSHDRRDGLLLLRHFRNVHFVTIRFPRRYSKPFIVPSFRETRVRPNRRAIIASTRNLRRKPAHNSSVFTLRSSSNNVPYSPGLFVRRKRNAEQYMDDNGTRIHIRVQSARRRPDYAEWFPSDNFNYVNTSKPFTSGATRTSI